MNQQLTIAVLLIEDDPIDAGQVKRELARSGRSFRVQWAETLQSGLAALRQDSFDVVLSDLSLPDSLGHDAPKAIRQVDPLIPLVVLTGFDDAELAETLLEAGAQDYVIKGSASGDCLERAIRHSIQRQQNYTKIRDLLGQVEANHALLERKNQKLAKLYAQAHEFVDNISHEFRTPLTVIKEYTSLIGEGLVGEVNSEQQRFLSIVEDRADDLNIMVDDMLDVSKLEADMLCAWRQNTTVADVLQRVQNSLERKAAVRDVTLRWQIAEDLPDVYCDAEKAGRALTNLAINAIKFCGDQGVVVIAADADPSQHDVTLAITDNGPGIDDESLATIFRRFKQLNSDVRDSVKGFGLGLNIAKELVHLNLGSLDVTSRVGQGSTFSFTLPRAVPTEIVRRYLKQIEMAQGDHPVPPTVSLIAFDVDPAATATDRDDVELFLHCSLRKSDILLRAAPSRWVIAKPITESEFSVYETRLQDELSASNRNRPFGPIASFAMRHLGAWHCVAQCDQILTCLEGQIVQKTEPGNQTPAIGLPLLESIAPHESTQGVR